MKRASALLLAAALLLCFAACGSGEKQTANAEESQAAAAGEPTSQSLTNFFDGDETEFTTAPEETEPMEPTEPAELDTFAAASTGGEGISSTAPTETSAAPGGSAAPSATAPAVPKTPLDMNKEELVAYFNRVSDRVKVDKPGYTWTRETKVENIQSPSRALKWVADQALGILESRDVLGVQPMDPAAKGADHKDFGVWGQSWSSKLTPSATRSAKITDRGGAWELRVDLKSEQRETLPMTEPDHEHGKVFKVFTYHNIYDNIEPYSWLATIEKFAPSYHDSYAVLTIDKQTDSLVRAAYHLVTDGDFKAKALGVTIEATATIIQHEIYTIG